MAQRLSTSKIENSKNKIYILSVIVRIMMMMVMVVSVLIIVQLI